MHDLFINICQFPRKLCEQEAARPSNQTYSEGPSNVNAMKSNRYSCKLYLIPTKIKSKAPLTHLNVICHALDSPKQNGVSCTLLKVIHVCVTSPRTTSCEQKQQQNDRPGSQGFTNNVMGLILSIIKFKHIFN